MQGHPYATSLRGWGEIVYYSYWIKHDIRRENLQKKTSPILEEVSINSALDRIKFKFPLSSFEREVESVCFNFAGEH